MKSIFKIESLKGKLLKEIKKEMIKKGGVFENIGQKQINKFSEMLKSGNYGHYYIDNLYKDEEDFRQMVFKIDDNFYKKVVGK